MYLPEGVTVHDDWLIEPLRSRLLEAINWMPMYFLNRDSRFETHKLDIHWYYPVAITDEALTGRVDEQLQALEDPLDAIRETWKLVAKQIGGKLGLYECTVSANTFGTEGSAHFDISRRYQAPAHFTVLIYCSPIWENSWAGETLIFDADGEISGGVMPRPGRVVVLRGDPYHVGRSVSRICPSDRRVLVFKFWDEPKLTAILTKTTG